LSSDSADSRKRFCIDERLTQTPPIKPTSRRKGNGPFAHISARVGTPPNKQADFRAVVEHDASARQPPHALTIWVQVGADGVLRDGQERIHFARDFALTTFVELKSVA
jgi:hypothetical protein